jgi:predicted ATPase
MKILKLEVEGFRSLKRVLWQPGDLNIIIGPNGTGKSNLLRILELISVSASGRLGKYIQSSGGMEPLLWDGQSDRIFFRVTLSPVEDLSPRHDQTYTVELARLGRGSTYRIDYEQLADYYQVDRGNKTTPFKHLERRNSNARIFDVDEHELVAPAEAVLEDELLLPQVSNPFTTITNRWIPAIQKGLAGWSIYHDIHVNRDAVIRQPVVARAEKRVTPDGQNLISVLHTLYTSDRYFKQAINSAMRAAFGDDFDELVFPPAADQRIQLHVRWSTLRNEQSAADLSDGTLRFLFLLAVLATPSPASLIAIDEPETGLHPSMLPIVAEYAADAAQRSQVILTTHSDQLLDAFGDIRPTTTVAKWSDGETTLTTLDDDKLAYWLKEYSLGALYRSRELENMP